VTREQLEHLLRASASVLINSGSRSRTHELVVIGSQAILGQYPQAPGELLRSMEADLYPLREPERAEEIDGAIGELSAFHDTYGYYAQGVGPETATLPAKWIERVIPVKSEATGQAIGLCLEAHDLAISKYVAGREKDMRFTFDLARHGLTRKSVLLERLKNTALPDVIRKLVRQRIILHFRK
jgi:uncharacterized nucleotidyltransferase DUF6036